MTVAFVRNHQALSSQTSNATVLVGIDASNASVIGNMLVAVVSFDNTGGLTPTVSSIAKMAGEGNSWVKLVSHDSSTNTSASGCRTEIWGIITTVTWTANSTYTVTLSASVGCKITELIEFDGVDTHTRITGQGTSTSSAPSADTSGGSSNLVTGDLVLGAACFETNTVVTTGDSDTTNGSWSTKFTNFTTGGGATSNLSQIFQYKIATGTGLQTYNPTHSTSTDSGACIAVLPCSKITVGTVTSAETAQVVTPTVGTTLAVGTASSTVTAQAVVATAAGLKISTLIDAFTGVDGDPPNSTRWPVINGAQLDANRLFLQNLGTGDIYAQSATFDFTSSEFIFKYIPDPGDQAAGYFRFGGTSIEVLLGYDSLLGTNLDIYSNNRAASNTVTYSVHDTIWFKVASSSAGLATVYTSTDGLAWTLRHTSASGILTSGTVKFISTDNAGSKFYIDNFNVVPSQTVTVGTASSSVTAQVVTPKVGVTLAVGTASSSDTAQTVTAILGGLTVAVGTASSSDTAQAISPLVGTVVTVGTASSVETAQAVTAKVGATVAVGTSSSTSAAQTVTPTIGAVVPTGTTISTDTAQAVTAIVGTVLAVGASSSTEAAQTVTPVVGIVLAVGSPSSTESAQIVVPLVGVTVQVGTAYSTDAPQGVLATVGTTVAVGTAASNEEAQAVEAIVGTVLEVGTVSSVETAQTVTPIVSAAGDVTLPVGTAFSDEVAQEVLPLVGTVLQVGAAISTDAAQEVVPFVGVTVSVGTASSSETAQSVIASVGTSVQVGTATSTSVAQSVTPRVGIALQVGTAAFTSLAQQVVPLVGTVLQVGTASSLNTVNSVTPRVDVTLEVGTASCIDTAQEVVPRLSVTVEVGTAVSTDTAHPVLVTVMPFNPPVRLGRIALKGNGTVGVVGRNGPYPPDINRADNGRTGGSVQSGPGRISKPNNGRTGA